ncbi:hypothetical protein D0B54_09440 [Solimonas sp. K1W22B-7]|nr:hypothetical protein D0B54_09440 [Solimonas sp. K1W22B-7]
MPGVRAGSGLLAVGPRLLALQDDARAVAWIDPATLQVRPQVLEGHGGALPKKEKPDYEALMRAPDGTIWLFGSGSKPNRRRSAQLRADGSVRLRDDDALYELLSEALGGKPNIEGALHLDDRLRLFHRGVAAETDAWVDLPATVLAGAAPRLLELRWLSLGEIDGVGLHLTDAAALGDGRTLYLAAAEYTSDAVADGPVSGAAVGIFDGAGARWAPLMEPTGEPSRRKVEGIAPEGDGRSGWLITDPDDAEMPAELCRYELEGNW